MEEGLEIQESQSNRVYELKDLFVREGEKVRRSEQVNRVVTHLLDSKRIYDATKALSTTDIISAYKKLQVKNPDIYDIPQNSLSVYMSYLSKNNVSRIRCNGTGQGYYLSHVSSLTSAKASAPKEEKMLYPILERWLSMRCDAVKDVSSKHRKGLWANPDVMGLNVHNIVGEEFIDITSIEAKLTMDNWRRDIFEAVSHSRFVNRSYFAFMCDHDYKVPSDIMLCAQEYGIGLIEIRLPKEWQSGDELDIEFISEILPAPRKVIAPRVQEEILKKYNVREVRDMFDNSTNWKTSKDFDN